MGIDSFPPWIPRVRKDPLGPVGYNELINQYRWAESLFGVEHILGTGEHNAAEISREVGSVYITAGPTANKEGFRYATGATRSAAGTVQLAIDSTKYDVTSQMALQVANCSENGINKPCMTTALIISTSQIEFYSKYLTTPLAAAGNAWAVDDAHFVAALHGTPLARGAIASVTGYHVKGETFSDLGAYLLGTPKGWNPYVAADAGLRSAFVAEHSTAGVHINREVARTYASIYYSGGAYRIRDSSTRNPCSAVTTVGTGHCKLTFTNAWSLSAQPFLMVDYARSNSGAQGDIIVGVTPRSLISTTEVHYYFYKYDTAALTWDRYNTDFFTVIHGGP